MVSPSKQAHLGDDELESWELVCAFSSSFRGHGEDVGASPSYRGVKVAPRLDEPQGQCQYVAVPLLPQCSGVEPGTPPPLSPAPDGRSCCQPKATRSIS